MFRPSLSHSLPRCNASIRTTSRCIGVRSSRFSTTSRSLGYEDTISNLKIGAHTRVLYQGFTGRQATVNAQESIEYGTNIVGGVKPGVEGEHLGLPVMPSVRAAVEKLKPDASAIYVPGNQAVEAIVDAIENEIPLIVAVAEHIPIHELLRIHAMLKTQSKSRLVGANCPGIISTIGRCRIGFQPLPCFSEGRVGVVAKSGTLSYETVGSLTRAGLGQTLCISMGGDVLAGTTFVDALKLFEHDDATEGIVICGEHGGRAEEDAAEWIKDYRKRTSKPKPIVAVVGGIEAPFGRIMGHAGAWCAPGEHNSKEKIKILEDAGVVTVNHPEKFGPVMKTLRDGARPHPQAPASNDVNQRRGFHTMRQRPRPVSRTTPAIQSTQKRTLYIKQSQAFDMLKERGVPTMDIPTASNEVLLAISIDRTAKSPCVIASPSTDPGDMFALSQKFPFTYGTSAVDDEALLTALYSLLNISKAAQPHVKKLLNNLNDIFVSKEAFVLETKVVVSEDGGLQVQGARFGFDDAAFRSGKRQADVHALRDKDAEVWEEVEAEKDQIVYVKLEGEGSVGTLVNGAGLAMNTVDALTIHGGHCANFLDTGGKATSETVKSSFKLIVSDPRVKAIFVNIFGGLTRCDMIAEGIKMAFKDLGLKVPVVVRLRGTNEEAGQKIIAESGLPLHAFDGFEEAAKKVISLTKGEGDGSSLPIYTE